MDKFSGKCGAPLGPNAKFCPSCGEKTGVYEPEKIAPRREPVVPLGVREEVSDNSKYWKITAVAALALAVGVIAYFAFRDNTDSNTEEMMIDGDTAVTVEEVVAEPLADTEYEQVEIAEYSEESAQPGMLSDIQLQQLNRKFSGTFDGYPITAWIKVDRMGNVSGRYCYDRMIEKHGDSPKMYFRLEGTYEDLDGEGEHFHLRSYEHGSADVFENIELSCEGEDSYYGEVVNAKSRSGNKHYMELFI